MRCQATAYWYLMWLLAQCWTLLWQAALGVFPTLQSSDLGSALSQIGLEAAQSCDSSRSGCSCRGCVSALAAGYPLPCRAARQSKNWEQLPGPSAVSCPCRASMRTRSMSSCRVALCDVCRWRASRVSRRRKCRSPLQTRIPINQKAQWGTQVPNALQVVTPCW